MQQLRVISGAAHAMRFRNEKNKPELLHAEWLRLANRRTLVAVLENYQNADGTLPFRVRNLIGSQAFHRRLAKKSRQQDPPKKNSRKSTIEKIGENTANSEYGQAKAGTSQISAWLGTCQKAGVYPIVF
jgi:hypothetical protein